MADADQATTNDHGRGERTREYFHQSVSVFGMYGTMEEPVLMIFLSVLKPTHGSRQYKQAVPSSNYGGGALMGAATRSK
jgi:hypothetical protein